jgi:hypothetical protein
MRNQSLRNGAGPRKTDTLPVCQYVVDAFPAKQENEVICCPIAEPEPCYFHDSFAFAVAIDNVLVLDSQFSPDLVGDFLRVGAGDVAVEAWGPPAPHRLHLIIIAVDLLNARFVHGVSR